MKIKNLLKFLFLLSIVLLLDCKKDKPENHIIYDGTTYSMGGGLLSSSGTSNGSGGYNYFLTLYSSGLTYDAVSKKMSGSGELMFFLLSSYTSPFGSRTYKYNNTNTIQASGTYSGCWLKHNLNASTNICTNIELYTGTLDIIDTGASVFSVNITINTTDNWLL